VFFWDISDFLKVIKLKLRSYQKNKNLLRNKLKYDKKEVNMLENKAQVTTFIIIGVVIIIGGAAAILLRDMPASEDSVEEITKGQIVPAESSAIKAYIESCIKTVSLPLIEDIGYNGGSLNPLSFKMYPINDAPVKFRYMCTALPGRGCVNRLTTRKSMQDVLNAKIKLGLETCIDLDQFRDMGYVVIEGEKSVNAKIASTDVNVELMFPITISKEEFKIELNQFSSNLRLELGKVFDLAVRILNSEILNGYFDQDEWMRQHGGEVVIEKHKPYPHTVYRLTKFNREIDENYTFNFAVEGEDTVSEILVAGVNVELNDFCNTDDGNCFANSEEGACNLVGGVYSETPSCGGASLYSDSSCYNGCDNCGARMHGESWCVYDAPVGEGRDYIGSRHYKQTCVDGKVLNTECRDYREELCTEDRSFNPKKAMCRTNRWFDCVGQRTEAECLNTDERDCYWNELFYDGTSHTMQREMECVPTVPPAFKHWEGKEQLVCNIANEQRTCDGLSCPVNWAESVARFCYMQGDCGNYRNTADVMTYGGYSNTDKDPRPNTYPRPNRVGGGDALELPFNRRNFDDLVGEAEWDIDAISNGYNDYLAQVNRWISQKKQLIMMAAMGQPLPIYTVQTALCGVWQAPSAGADCEDCNGDELKPCSEYKCKSYGQACSYSEITGAGMCNNPYAGDNDGPIISFEPGLLSANYTYEDSYFLDFFGILVKPGVPPYGTISVGIKTDEGAICSYAPIPTDFDGARDLFGGIYTFTETRFSTMHAFNMTISPFDVFATEIADMFNTFTLLSLTRFNFTDEYLAELREDAISISDEFGRDEYIQRLDEMQQTYENTLKPAIQNIFFLFDDTVNSLTTGLMSGRQVWFFNCIDRSGNENEEVFFIEFTQLKDEEDPIILGSVPLNGSIVLDPANFKVFVNEPALCKYSIDVDRDYDSMDMWMDCETSVLDYIADNSIDCRSTVSLTGEHKIYIKCKDQPPIVKEYAFHLIRGNNFSVESNAASNINYTQSLINITDTVAIEENRTKITVNVGAIDVLFKLDKTMEGALCRYSDTPGMFDDLVDEFNCEGRVCMKTFSSDTSSYIRCKKEDAVPVIRNVNTESYTIVYRTS